MSTVTLTDAQQATIDRIVADMTASGFVAWKYNDPIEDARWIDSEDEARQIAADDPSLIVWTRHTLISESLEDALRDFSPLPRDEVEALIAEHPGAVVVHRSPDIDWPMGTEYVVPDEGLILDADGRTVTL